MPSVYYIPYTPLFYYLALHLVVFAVTRNLAVFFSVRVVYHVAGFSLPLSPFHPFYYDPHRRVCIPLLLTQRARCMRSLHVVHTSLV